MGGPPEGLLEEQPRQERNDDELLLAERVDFYWSLFQTKPSYENPSKYDMINMPNSINHLLVQFFFIEINILRVQRLIFENISEKYNESSCTREV